MASEMRVLHIVPFYTPKRGGSVMALHALALELVNNKHEVTILTSDFEFDQKFAESIPGLKVVPVASRLNLGLFIYSPEMKRWLKDNLHTFDVVHMHNFRSHQNAIVRKMCLKLGKPYIVQAHGSLPNSLGKKFFKKLFDAVWGRRILRDSSFQIAVSEEEKDQYLQIIDDPKKIVVIPNIVEKRPPAHPSGHFRSLLKVGERKIVLFLGRLSPVKGLPFLIDSFALIAKDRKDVVLAIVGPSEEGMAEKLRQQVEALGLKESVVLTEGTNDVGSAFADAAVVVYPSVYEIFGLVPFEALLIGTPVIVTSSTGCGRIIKEQDIGQVVEYDNKKALADAIVNALDDQKGMRDIASKGAKFVEANFNGRTIVRRYEAVYADCVRDR